MHDTLLWCTAVYEGRGVPWFPDHQATRMDSRLVVRSQAADLDRQLLSVMREDVDCYRSMTIPGVGASVAASFMAAVETLENFTTSHAVGAWIGLTRDC